MTSKLRFLSNFPVLLTLTLLLLTSSLAQDKPMVDGEVREVRPGGELTIKHGPIPNLDMGAMVMVFKTSNPNLSKGLKVGDKVQFQADDVEGKLTIIKLEKVE